MAVNPGHPPRQRYPTIPNRRPKKRSLLVLLISACVVAGILVFWGVIAVVSYSRELAGAASPPVPDKYHDGDFTDCTGFTAHSPDLPPVVHQVARVADPRVADSGLLQCAFDTAADDGPSVTLKADWSLTNDAGDGSGKERSNFVGVTSGSSDNTPVGINLGQDARWLDENDGKSCALILLDRNASFEVHYTQSAAGADPRSEACRGPLRKVTQELYAAAQPR